MTVRGGEPARRLDACRRAAAHLGAPAARAAGLAARRAGSGGGGGRRHRVRPASAAISTAAWAVAAFLPPAAGPRTCCFGWTWRRSWRPGDLQYEDGKLWKFQQAVRPELGSPQAADQARAGEPRVPGPPARRATSTTSTASGLRRAPAGERGRGLLQLRRRQLARGRAQLRVRAGRRLRPGSPQGQWLRADLAAHPAACTLAFWHHPRFSSGRHERTEGKHVRDCWQALYDGERRPGPQRPRALLRALRARRRPTGALTVRAACASSSSAPAARVASGYVTSAPNSELRENRYYGVLKLTLQRGQLRLGARHHAQGSRSRRRDVELPLTPQVSVST